MHGSMIVATTAMLLVLGLAGYVDSRDLRVGAFNIQVFGKAKAAKPEVMEHLVTIVRRYDVLLIQEIRDISGEAIVKLLNQTNAGQAADMQFSMMLSPRLGRTSSKEQYAYLYRSGQGISVKGNYVYDDGDENLNTDTFEREPYIVAFESATSVLSSFTLVGIHVDPDTAVQEINELYKVYPDAINQLGNSNVMVLGDLNADCSYVRASDWENIIRKTDTSFTWWIGNEADTTVKSTDCAYDRFVSQGDGWADGIVTNSASVYLFHTDLGINSSLAADISDHYPIEFLLKQKSFAVYTKVNVYVALDDPTKSLSKTTLFDVDGATGGVFDANNVHVATIRNNTQAEINLKLALENIAQDFTTTGEEVTMNVQPTKNRYSGSQKCDLTIKVAASQGAQTTVETRLDEKNVSYTKTLE